MFLLWKQRFRKQILFKKDKMGAGSHEGRNENPRGEDNTRREPCLDAFQILLKI